MVMRRMLQVLTGFVIIIIIISRIIIIIIIIIIMIVIIIRRSSSLPMSLSAWFNSPSRLRLMRVILP